MPGNGRYPAELRERAVGMVLENERLYGSQREAICSVADQLPHLFKHSALGVPDIVDVWQNDPLVCPPTPPAHWLMVSEVSGAVLVVPLAPSASGDPTRRRPIGCYEAPSHLVSQYMEDR